MSSSSTETLQSFFWALGAEDWELVQALADSLNRQRVGEPAATEADDGDELTCPMCRQPLVNVLSLPKGAVFVESQHGRLLNEHLDRCAPEEAVTSATRPLAFGDGFFQRVEDREAETDDDPAHAAITTLSLINAEFPDHYRACLRFNADYSPRVYKTGPSGTVVPVRDFAAAVKGTSSSPSATTTEPAVSDELILSLLCQGLLPKLPEAGSAEDSVSAGKAAAPARASKAASGPPAKKGGKKGQTGTPSATTEKFAAEIHAALARNSSVAATATTGTVFRAKDAGRAAVMDDADGPAGSAAVVSQAAIDLLESLECICGSSGGHHTSACSQRKYDAARARAEALLEERRVVLQKMVAFGKGRAKAVLSNGSTVDVSGGSMLSGKEKTLYGGAVRAGHLDQARELEKKIQIANAAASRALFLKNNEGTVATASIPAPTIRVPGPGPVVGMGPGSRPSPAASSLSPSAGAGSGVWSSNSAASSTPSALPASEAAGHLVLVSGSGAAGSGYKVDFHGQHADEAKTLARAMLSQCVDMRALRLEIVTGKGKHSTAAGSGKGSGTPSAGGASAPMKKAVGAYLFSLQGDTITSESGAAGTVSKVMSLEAGFEVTFRY